MEVSKLLFIVLVLLIISCQDKKEQVQHNSREVKFKTSYYFSEERIKKAKYRVKYYGDIVAFGDLSVYYSYNELKKEEFLPYILLMVEKYKHYKYCTIAFNSFLEFYAGSNNQYDGTQESLIMHLSNLNKLNNDQRQYVLYFVKLGAANNNFESIRLLELIYREGIGVDQSETKADSLKIVLERLNK